MKKVLVYGSLRQGMYNYNYFKSVWDDIKKIKTTKVKGYDLYSLGSYPGIVEGDINSEVVVDLLEVPDDAYDQIYRMEIGAGYHEMDIKLDDDTIVPIYVYGHDVDVNNHVKSGDWVEHRTALEVVVKRDKVEQ